MLYTVLLTDEDLYRVRSALSDRRNDFGKRRIGYKDQPGARIEVAKLTELLNRLPCRRASIAMPTTAEE